MLLQTRCPVDINTGEFVKQVRAQAVESQSSIGAASSSPSSPLASRLATYVANHFRMVNYGVPLLLNTVDVFHGILGPKPLEVISGALNRWTNHLIPQWNPYIPKVWIYDVECAAI